MGKGSADTRSPDYEARREAHDRIFGGNSMGKSTHAVEYIEKILNKTHPRGSCVGLCSECEGGCDES